MATEPRCLARLGQHEETLAALGDDRDDPAARAAEMEILIRQKPKRAVRIVGEKKPETDEQLVVIVDATAVLVEMDEAEFALTIFDRGAEFASRSFIDNFIAEGNGVMLDPRSQRLQRQRYHLVRAKALHALGRQNEARGALAKAESFGVTDRLMLEVRKLLR